MPTLDWRIRDLHRCVAGRTDETQHHELAAGRVTIKLILMLGVLTPASAGGEIAMTYGMKRTGELEATPSALGSAIAGPRREVRLGLAGLALARGVVLLALDLAVLGPISLVIPASAFNYVAGTLARSTCSKRA